MELSTRANVLLILFCLAVGGGSGAALAEGFVEWLEVPNNHPLELVAAGLAYLGFGAGLGCYFVCISAIRRIRGPADRLSQETDYDDKPTAKPAD
jgi:hypothetical protein